MNTVGEWVGRDPAGPVAPARRDRTAVDAHVGRDGLQRVVRPREEREVRGGRGTRPVQGELREPEAVEVRLVPDDDVLERRRAAHDRGRVRGERRRCASSVSGVVAEPGLMTVT